MRLSVCSASQLVRKRLAAPCKPYSEKPYCVRKRAKACVRAGLSERGILRAACQAGSAFMRVRRLMASASRVL